MLTDTPLPWLVLVILVFRFFLGPLSISAGTSGGILTPMLLMGALGGAMMATATNLLPFMDLPVNSFAFVGMSAMFAGSLRAPLTGIILTVEMAASMALIVPALMAAGGAVLTATLLRNPPLLDSLAPRSVGYRGPMHKSAGPPKPS
jgi:CIC family chloride channel protein